jgi:hypothetical protein
MKTIFVAEDRQGRKITVDEGFVDSLKISIEDTQYFSQNSVRSVVLPTDEIERLIVVLQYQLHKEKQ